MGRMLFTKDGRDLQGHEGWVELEHTGPDVWLDRPVRAYGVEPTGRARPVCSCRWSGEPVDVDVANYLDDDAYDRVMEEWMRDHAGPLRDAIEARKCRFLVEPSHRGMGARLLYFDHQGECIVLEENAGYHLARAVEGAANTAIESLGVALERTGRPGP